MSSPGSGRPLTLGVICYPTTGGSGVIATEIGLALFRRGHHVHFICYDVPGRLRSALAQPSSLGLGTVFFHRVEVNDYPLPHLDAYALALASRLAEVSTTCGLELLHLHYAIPHATSAYLARQILGSQSQKMPRTLVTLHGTDITRVGSDPALLPVNRFSLLHSDALTVPSAFLRQAAYENLALPESTPIEVIPNFVDSERFHPAKERPRSGEPVLIHSSNFRPLKRVGDVVRIFAGVRRVLPARLLLVGDGPERPAIEALVQELGLKGAVSFLGLRIDFLSVLQKSDVFLLPSDTEGFGLAALEALSCGVPVVASRVGGVPEVVTDGETGLLCAVGDVAEMTAAVLRLLGDPALHARMSAAGRKSVEEHFRQEPMVARYEALYRRVLERA